MQKTRIVGLLSLIALSVSGQAKENAVFETKPGYELKNNQLPEAYNAPGRVQTSKCWNCFANASFIYWQPLEGGLEVAEYVHGGSGFIYKFMSLDFHPGFKVEIGLNSGFDDWDSSLGYVRLHTCDVDHFRPPAGWTMNDYFLDGVSVSSMSSTFKLHYDMLQLAIGRYFYNGKNLTLRPNIGIKGGWINQYLNTSGPDVITPTFTDFTKIKSTSWLTGPRFGMNSKWILGKGFRLFGDVEFAWLYQSLKVHYRLTQIHTGAISTRKNFTSPSRITPNLGAILGIGWGSYFNGQKYHCDLSAGYEFQYYFHQNMAFVSYISRTTVGAPIPDDLMLQGLSAKVQFDF